MGKPIKKVWFGDPNAPTATGDEIVMTADLGSGEVDAWVIKQTGTSEYKLTDGVDIADCYLVQTITGPKEAILECYPFSGGTETVRVLTQHRMKTYEGNDYDWINTTEKDGQAQLKSAAAPLSVVIDSATFPVSITSGAGTDSVIGELVDHPAAFTIVNTVTGGSAPLTHVWTYTNADGTNSPIVIAGQTTATLTTDIATLDILDGIGTYVVLTLTVTDNNAAIISTTSTLEFIFA